jgi:hypothetical protein
MRALLSTLASCTLLFAPLSTQAKAPSESGWFWSPTILDMGMSVHDGGNMGFVWRPGLTFGYMNHVLRPDMGGPLQRLKDLKVDMEELTSAIESGKPFVASAAKRTKDKMMRKRNIDYGWPINWGFGVYADVILDTADLEIPDKTTFPSMYGYTVGVQAMWKWFGVYGGLLPYMERFDDEARVCSPNSNGFTSCTTESMTVTGSGWEAGITIAFKSFWTTTRSEIPVGYGLVRVVRPRIADILGIFAVRLSGGQITFDNTTDSFGMVTVLLRPHFLLEYDPTP